jgi:hypothetical protein
MFPRYHALYGFLFSVLIVYIFPDIGLLGGIIIFLSSVLIDVDHYLTFVYDHKNISLTKAYRWHINAEKKLLSMPREERNKTFISFCFLHGFETVSLLVLVGYLIHEYFFFVAIGFAFHLFLDLIDEPKYVDRLDKFSLIYDYFKFKKLNKLEL